MLRLRQIAFAARDLAAAEKTLAGTLSLDLCYRDPQIIVFGLENALFPVGDQFLEVVSPVKPDTTAGRLLDKRGSDCGYMAIFQTDDLEGARRRLQDANVRVVYDAVGEGIRGLHLHPKDVEGAIVSIDAAEEPAEWPWAGPAWRSHVDTSKVSKIVGIDVTVPSPGETARVWGRVLGVAPRGLTLEVDETAVRFVRCEPADRRRGITAIDLLASSPELAGHETEMLGTTIRFSR